MRGEAREQAADVAADRVTRMSGGASDLSRVRSGSPLDRETRASMQTHFQHDFSRVRVHTDDAAAQSAHRLSALAYTKGNDVVIGREGLALDSIGRHRLLAHELAHVVQQSNGLVEGIQRKPLFPIGRTNYRFDTGQINADDLNDPEITGRLNAMAPQQLRAYLGMVTDSAVRTYIISLLARPPMVAEGAGTIDDSHVDDVAAAKYWFQRTSEVYDVTETTLQNIPEAGEEQDAVFATVWNVWPDGPPSGAATEAITIPPTTRHKKSRLFEVRVLAPAAPGRKPQLEIRLITERSGEIGEDAPQPPSTFKTPSTIEFSMSPNDPTKWLKDHPEERRQIAYWLERQAGKFDGVLITRSGPPGGKGPPRETTFHLKGTKEKDKPIEDLSIDMVDDQRPRVVAPPADFREHDYADLLIHKAQTTPHETLRDKLGAVDVSGVPANEALAVKVAIVQYWNGKNRDMELNAAVPMPGSDKQVYYTIRFLVAGDVEVARVGEKGSDPKFKPNDFDVGRAHGFADNASDPAKFKSWLGKRYPGVKPAGTTVAEMRESANKDMKAGVGAAKWYDDNYKIVVLEEAAARARLKSVHGQVNKQVPPAEMMKFTEHELKFAELTLQTLNDRMLAIMKSLRLGRQLIARKKNGEEEKTAGGGPVGAMTFLTGSNRTIIFYGKKKEGPDLEAGFLGGTEGVHARETELIAHEFGHVVEHKLGARAAFNKFVKKEGIKAFTGYASDDPNNEFFPEAFETYQTDPGFLLENYPRVHAWIDELVKTGKIPKL